MIRTGAIDDFKEKNKAVFSEMGARVEELHFSCMQTDHHDATRFKAVFHDMARDKYFPSSVTGIDPRDRTLVADARASAVTTEAMHKKTCSTYTLPLLVILTVHLLLILLA